MSGESMSRAFGVHMDITKGMKMGGQTRVVARYA